MKFSFLREAVTFANDQSNREETIEKETLGSELNQFDMQYFPSIDASGDLVFTARDKSWRGHEQIMISQESNNNWIKPILISENINSELNEGTASISADGRTLVFTGCNREGGFGSCDLYMSRKFNGEWTEAELLPNQVNSRFWDSQPSLNAFGDKLYFVSTRPGIGGQDIWLSQFLNDKWTEAVNLGTSVNTTEDDASPYIYPDDRTLFFASNGRPGMGRLDLFSTYLENGKWTEAVNLGGAINDHNDQAGYCISIDGWAYYSSTQPDGRVIMKRFRMPEELVPEIDIFNLSVKVIDSVSRQPLQARLFSSNSALKFQQVAEGAFESFSEMESVEVRVESEGYYVQNALVSSGETIIEMVPVLVIPKDRVITFNTDVSELSSYQKEVLIPIAEWVQKNRNFRLQITSYTDSQGSKEYNQILSERRLQSVKNYLISLGLKEELLTGSANGQTLAVESIGNNMPSESYRKVVIKLIEW